MLFLRVLEMPFNDKRGILFSNLFAVTAFESVVLFLYSGFMDHAKAYS